MTCLDLCKPQRELWMLPLGRGHKALWAHEVLGKSLSVADADSPLPSPCRPTHRGMETVPHSPDVGELGPSHLRGALFPSRGR